jgi:hypothetical protein
MLLGVSEPAHLLPFEISARLADLADSWAGSSINERGSFQTWLIRFCEALEVEPPDPPTDDYRFELPIRMMDREGRESPNFIDCWKKGHFALEAKASAAGAAGLDEPLLRKAYGQVRNYVAHVSGDPPPYLMVLDVARTLIVWDRWSGAYGDFAAGRRIALPLLHERPEDIALLRDIFVDPTVRDPRGKAQLVSKEIAAGLAELAAELESRGLDTERVARFLMRCVFSCFAEDVGLLPENLFRRTLETARDSGNRERLTLALTALWNTMDTGGMFGAEMLHRFNGHFFKTVEALPLEARDVDLLIDAAKHDWSRVEPSIFGTLLVRALDPEERHRLGAEYTPRAYIERLVEPTVVEPIRERWTAVQAAVLQLEESEKLNLPKKLAKSFTKEKQHAGSIKQLLAFHDWLRALSFLDPACGSGNFLYVTMAAVKRVEIEVLNEIARLSGGQGGLVLEEVHPRQFHGIEVKPWAREIAELTLWIGYHQFWRESHGGRTPPDPILEDTGTIECRDAVLSWDAIVHRPEKDRPDPTPRIVHPVTGELVPDPNAKLPYYEYVGARQAEWPRADFIVGNPPYIGNKRMREALGSGYAEALRAIYPAVPITTDFVMYWWYKASQNVATGETLRAGLITTNTITQVQNRAVVDDSLNDGVAIVWAMADHPWVDEVAGAAIRVAMTVVARDAGSAVMVSMDKNGNLTTNSISGKLNSDLSSLADVPSTAKIPLLSNSGLASRGFQLIGAGFQVSAEEAHRLIALDASHGEILRPYRNGRDLASRPRELFVIDFGLRSESQAREYPVLFTRVNDSVRSDRVANARESYSRFWWRFGEPRPTWRAASASLHRYIATPQTAKHRFFVFLDREIAPDDMVIAIASENPFHLGILSSAIHQTWAFAAGGRLGVGNDPRYNQSLCFSPFPFPLSKGDQIAFLANKINEHRESALVRDACVTMTGMYNVVEKLRSGEALTPKERAIHEIAACGVLRDMHDELDALVAEAYGWPWPMEKEEILERLVALHDERVEEEARGVVRWLRPEYQIPRFGSETTPATLDLRTAVPIATPRSVATIPVWPTSAVDQLAALSALVSRSAVTTDEASANFVGARRDLVQRHLETLALMGEVTLDVDGRYQAARKVA